MAHRPRCALRLTLYVQPTLSETGTCGTPRTPSSTGCYVNQRGAEYVTISVVGAGFHPRPGRRVCTDPYVGRIDPNAPHAHVYVSATGDDTHPARRGRRPRRPGRAASTRGCGVFGKRRYTRKKASLAQREVARRSRDGGIAVHRAVGYRATPQSPAATAPLTQGRLVRGAAPGPRFFVKKRGKKLQA